MKGGMKKKQDVTRRKKIKTKRRGDRVQGKNAVREESARKKTDVKEREQQAEGEVDILIWLASLMTTSLRHLWRSLHHQSTLDTLGPCLLMSKIKSCGASAFSSCEWNSFAICLQKNSILILMNIKWLPLKVKQIILGFSGCAALWQSWRATMIFH